MIFDFDVHHGNGTNDVFYEEEDVLFVSTHQQGSYPGTGKLSDAGSGGGEGTSINLPLPGGLSCDHSVHIVSAMQQDAESAIIANVTLHCMIRSVCTMSCHHLKLRPLLLCTGSCTTTVRSHAELQGIPETQR